MQTVLKYWPEGLIFGGIFTVLLICMAPDITWINTDCDGPHYIYSAKHLYPAHKMSAPLYLLASYPFVNFIPFGTDAWQMALMSVLPAAGTAVLIYLCVHHLVGSRAAGLLGALVWGSSALVISQSTIIESYALVTFLGMLAYYASLKQKWLLCALALGAAGAVHHLAIIPILVLLIAHRPLRRWRYLGIMALFTLFYLYVPLASREPYMWGNEGWKFFNDNTSTGLMLIGGLSIWDLPKRILDTVGIVGLSIAAVAIPIHFGLRGRWLREPLFWLALLPVVYYLTDLAPQTYVYVMPAIAYFGVLAGIGITRLPNLYRGIYGLAAMIALVALMGWHCWSLDIGRTLDPNLAARQYYNSLDEIPDGDILIAQQGWEWAAIFYYNKEEDRNIIPVCVGSLPSPLYQEQLAGYGVITTDYPEEPLSTRPTMIALSILENHGTDGVWLTKATDPSVYGTSIVPSASNAHLLEEWMTGLDESTVATWSFAPSNPYDIITGSIEIEEWKYITMSNYSMVMFGMLACIGAVPVWIFWQFAIKRRKWGISAVMDKVKQEV